MPCCSQAQFPGCCDYWPPAAAMSRDLKGEFATMRNKSVIVTGATAGIGRAAALQLASLRADVVVTGRDPERGRATEEALRAAGSPRARFVRADHSTLDGNLALAAEVKHLVDRVDVLVNNVGGLMPRRQITADDAEMTLALNVRARGPDRPAPASPVSGRARGERGFGRLQLVPRRPVRGPRRGGRLRAVPGLRPGEAAVGPRHARPGARAPAGGHARRGRQPRAGVDARDPR